MSAKKAKRERHAALRKFKTNPTKENLEFFKNCRARAQRTIKEAKQETWKNFTSKINTNTKTKTVWDMIKKISGGTPPPETPCEKRSNKSNKQKDIANLLAETFSQNSSSRNLNKKNSKVTN